MSLPDRIASFPVVLRPFALADAPRVAELCGDWEVARMTSLIPHPYSLESSRVVHRRMPRDPCEAARPAPMRSPAPTTGCSSARSGSRARPRPGSRWATGSAGRTGATATRRRRSRAIIALAFSRLDIDVLTAIHLVRNPASGRVMAKCGMSEVRREMRPHRDGTPEEFRVWTIDREAWDRAAQRSTYQHWPRAAGRRAKIA